MVYVFFANGFEEIEALTPVDVLRRAGVALTTVGVGGTSVVGSHGVRVETDIPDTCYCDMHPEMIILPGGMPGSKNLDGAESVNFALKNALLSGAYIAAICAAPMVLGERGMLEGKKATCYPGFEQYLAGADVSTDGVVRDGKIITGKGMGVALDFSLELVSTLCGEEKANEIAASVMKNC